MADDKNQWNAKGVSDRLKEDLAELESDFSSRWQLLEYLMGQHKMNKIKSGELKNVEKATMDAISGDFQSLDELTRAIQRVFLGMVEKLGYREAEAVKEADVLKVRIESLIHQHDAETKEQKKLEKELIQQLDKLRLEYASLQKDAALFEEKEKNLLEKLESKEAEVKQHLDRIAKLDNRISEMEPLQENNRKLQTELQQKEQELSSKENEHNHVIQVLELKHERMIAEKIKESNDEVSAEFSLKLDQLRDKLEEQMEKKVAATRDDERIQSEKRLSDLREQLKAAHDEEVTKLKKSYSDLLAESNK